MTMIKVLRPHWNTTICDLRKAGYVDVAYRTDEDGLWIRWIHQDATSRRPIYWRKEDGTTRYEIPS